jgi:hypothetical protein
MLVTTHLCHFYQCLLVVCVISCLIRLLPPAFVVLSLPATFAAIRGMLSLGALITSRCLPLLLLTMVGCCVFCLAEEVADENFSRKTLKV